VGQVEIGRRPWRRRTYIWALSGLTTISALIYWEQTAILFVLSTLAMCVLLLVVAFADLEGRDKELHKESDRLKPAAESNPAKDTPELPDSSTRKRRSTAA
jgi:hypothetical protein